MKEHLVNERIHAREVRVIGTSGEQLGIMSTSEALAQAREEGLDLVCVAPQESTPVCKITDYGRFRYEATKKERESKKGQRHVLKELKISPKIGIHDYEVKLDKLKVFLSRGDRVKVNIFFRGREITHKDRGLQLADRLIREIEELGATENPPQLEGKSITFVLAPKDQKKVVKKIGKREHHETKTENPEVARQTV